MTTQNEVLWHLQQQSRSLQEFREEIRLTWDDQASKELNSRYLNPHEEEDDKMLKSLLSQSDSSEVAGEEIRISNDHVTEANRQSNRVIHQIQMADLDTKICLDHHNQHREDLERSKATILQVDEYILKARKICEGIPTE